MTAPQNQQGQSVSTTLRSGLNRRQIVSRGIGAGIGLAALGATGVAMTSCGGSNSAPTNIQGGQGGQSGAVSPPPPVAKTPGLSLGGDLVPVHDPAIIAADGKYHIFSTSHEDEAPGLIHWRTSDDLLNWSRNGAVFNTIPAWAKTAVPKTTGIWAPDIIYTGGQYRLYYSISSFGKNTSAIGLVTTPSLAPVNGQAVVWTDQGMITQSLPNNDYNAIDPAVYIDNRGRHWMSFGSFWSGIKQIELDPDSGAALHNSTDIHALASRPDPGAVEAPFVHFRNGYYYLFVSFEFCCRGVNSTYHTVVGRSRDPKGPYIGEQGVDMMDGGGTRFLHADDDPTRQFVGTGHMSLLDDQDKQYAVYHAYDTQQNGVPTLRIAQINWKNDWPSVV